MPRRLRTRTMGTPFWTNLYSRASDVIHNWGRSKETALWILTGTAEVAELADASRPQANPPVSR